MFLGCFLHSRSSSNNIKVILYCTVEGIFLTSEVKGHSQLQSNSHEAGGDSVSDDLGKFINDQKETLL